MKWMIIVKVIAAVVLSACSRKFVTYSSLSASALEKRSGYKGTITIDDSYETYLRTVYRVDSSDQKTLRMNFDDGVLSNRTLLELEYLLISKRHNTAIYISTISDQYQDRYSDRPESSLNEINVYDFKVLLFGTLDKDGQIVFQSRNTKDKDYWKLKALDNGGIALEALIEEIRDIFQLYIPADMALHERIKFDKLDNASFVYRVNEKTAAMKSPKFNNAIHFQTKCKLRRPGNCKKYRMYFSFDGSLKAERNFPSVYMRDKRIGSDPAPLFDTNEHSR